MHPSVHPHAQKRQKRDFVWAPTNGDNGGPELIDNINGFTTKNNNDR